MMGVYVDHLKPTIPSREWRYDQACHMFADTPFELHKLAARIGLNRAWYDAPGQHYDLTANKRGRALLAGAKEARYSDVRCWLDRTRAARIARREGTNANG
jgi:hypothetical protein